MIGIYKITNLINNKVYIGQSVNIQQRFKKHKTKYKDISNEESNKILYKAMRKYGLENFSFEIIEECSINQLDLKEKQWIAFYNSYENGYNATRGSQAEEYLQRQHKTSNFLTKNQVQQIKNQLKNNFTISTDQLGKKFNVSGRTIRDINTGNTWHDQNESYPIRKQYASLTNNYEKLGEHYCKICGKQISKGATYCPVCYKITIRKVKDRPSREQLKKLIREKTFMDLGRMYGVRDNTIRKWCDAYNLPRKKTEITQYSDDQWNLI